ncbi:MAG: alpha/beta fold hydrolase [Gammaproteobacteria bacterium]
MAIIAIAAVAAPLKISLADASSYDTPQRNALVSGKQHDVSEHPFTHRRNIHVSDYFTEARLKFDPRTNPTGIFSSPDGDRTTFSDAAARQELVKLNTRGAESLISYIDVGDPDADPIVLFHGIPTSAYEWRNIIPILAEHGRVIAFDQIGQGYSSKHRELTYTWKQQLAYVEAFFYKLGLQDKNIAIVVTDTGATLGLSYAARHPEQIKGIAFFESVLGPISSINDMTIQAQVFRSDEGNEKIITENTFVENLIVHSSEVIPPNDRPFSIRSFTPEEIRAYRRPYLNRDNRRVLAQWIREVPVIGGAPDGFGDSNIRLWLQFVGYMMTDAVPKLYLYASPGVLNTQPVVDFVLANFNTDDSLTAVNLGFGYHFLHEDYPEQVGEEIARWYRGLF